MFAIFESLSSFLNYICIESLTIISITRELSRVAYMRMPIMRAFP